MEVPIKINTNTIKIILISVIIVTISVIIGYYVGKRNVYTGAEETLTEMKDDASMSLDKVHQDSIRDGKKEWSLDAKSVQVKLMEKQTIFNELSAVYFLKGNKKLYITANKGILNTESKDIEIIGDVAIKNENYKLNTEVLYFDNKKRKIYSKTPVKIFDGSSYLKAKSMTLDLNTSNITFDGVRGEFTGEMSL